MIFRCEETVMSFKKDYIKLLRILKDKDADIDVLKKKLDEKDDLIASLHDKLLSVVVLEHKVKEIDKKCRNDIERSIEAHKKQLKDIEETIKFSPNFFHRINSYEDSQRKLENTILQTTLEKNKILKRKKMDIQEKNNINLKLTNSLSHVRSESDRIKETLSCKNKEIYSLKMKNKMFVFSLL